MMILAATTEPDRGWGGPAALAGAVLVFWLFTYLYRRFVARNVPSPTPLALPGAGGKPQITAGVDPLNPAGDPHGAPALEPTREPLALDWGHVDYGDGPARVPVPPAIEVPTEQEPETLDDFVAERLETQRPADVIRAAKERFGKSPATVKRAIRRVRDQREEQQ